MVCLKTFQTLASTLSFTIIFVPLRCITSQYIRIRTHSLDDLDGAFAPISIRNRNLLLPQLCLVFILICPSVSRLPCARCPLDFVELPSQLFESYARDFRVVSRFAKHHRTGQPIPEAVFRAAVEDEGRFAGLNMVDNLIQAMTDQLYHSASPLARSTTQTLLSVQQEFNPLDFSDAPLQLRHGHLCGYAAGYYSYLWCQALSSMIWNKCFRDDPLSRRSGDLLRKHVLAHGNARHPWDMLEDLLG